MSQTTRSRQDLIWFSAFLLMGSVAYLARAVDNFAAVPGDLGDARFNSVILEHVLQWVTGKVDTLWSPPFFYPFENILAFSDNHFGSSPFYIVFRLLGLSRELAFDAWFITGYVMNYAAAYVVSRRLALSPFAAGACAFVFTFALPALAQEGHAQLTYRFAIPLAFGALLDSVSQRRLLVAWRAAFWTAVQFYCSIYLGVFLVYLLVATAAFAMWPRKGAKGSFHLIRSIALESNGAIARAVAAVAASVLAVAALLYKYKSVSTDYGFGESLDYIASMLPRISSYVLADRAGLSSWLGSFVQDVPMRHEHQMFVGIVVALLAIFGATGKWAQAEKATVRKTALGALFVMVILTLSVGGYSLYFMVLEVPGLGAIRAVTRVVLVLLWPIALLVGLGVERMQSGLEGSRMRIKVSALIVIALLIAAEVFAYNPSNTSIYDWEARQHTLGERITQNLSSEVVLFVTVGAEHWSLSELDSMILAQDLGVATFNGYSGRGPPGNTLAATCLAANDRMRAYADFRGQTEQEMEDLANRAVCIDRDSELKSPVLTLRHSLTPDQAEGLVVTITSLTVSNESFDATIRVSNGGAVSISTWSLTNPVRLSWRLVPVRNDGSRLSEPPWNSRKDVAWTLQPGEFRTVGISGSTSIPRGKYLLEVSLVQEQVAWLHDLGMNVASLELKVGEAE